MKKVVVGLISRINNKKSEYLLISTKENFGKYTGLYYPPGGHINNNEDEQTALIREIKEELGVIVRPIKRIATTPGDVKDQVTFWWQCDCPDTNFSINNDVDKDTVDVRWFTEDELKDGTKLWPATKKLFQIIL